MTTFDKDGEVRSHFSPPRGADGRAMTHRDWLPGSLLARLEAGETREAIEAQLAQALGQSIIWHGNADKYAESIRIAIGVLRQACGFPNAPTLRLDK